MPGGHLRRDSDTKADPPGSRFDPDSARRLFDRPGVAAAYRFGSAADASPHPLSDVDLAYLGTDGETEDRLFDDLCQAFQRELGEGAFDLVPLRQAPLHLQFAIATAGTPLLVREPVLAEEFGTRAIVRFLDFKPHRDRYFATRV